EVGADAVAVVDQHGAAGDVEVGLGQGHDAVRRRANGGALRRCDIHARVRRARLAVVDPGAAEAAADAALDGPGEMLGEAGEGSVLDARGRHQRLLAADALGDLRRRLDRAGRHAIDPLQRPVAGADGDLDRPRLAVRRDDGDPRRAAGIAADAEYHASIPGNPQPATRELHLAL